MTKNKGEKPGDDSLENLGGENPTNNSNSTPAVDEKSELLDLVKKLSKQVEAFDDKFKDQEQQIKDLKDLKSSPGIEGMADLIKEIKKGNLNESEENNPLRYYTQEEIDPEDVLKEPVIFYSYGYGRVIVDDRRNGKPVRTPFGTPIFFMHQATQKVKDGKHTHLHSYATYPSYSKKEVKWLKEHLSFGTLFFETAKEAMDVNSDIAARITKHLSYLANLEPAQIVNIYRTKGLPNTADVNKMKNALALEAVKEEVQNERTGQEKYFKDLFDSKEIKNTFNA